MSGNKISFVWIIALSAGPLVGCYKYSYESPRVEVPDIKIEFPKIDINYLFKTCNKKESEQPEVSPEVLKNKVVIRDFIKNTDLEYIDCKGNILGSERGPEREFTKYLEIPAPTDLPEPVKYVSIENFKTCAKQEFDALGTYLIGNNMGSQSTTQGKVSVKLSDSKFRYNLYLNVHDGINVLKIKYFGRCKKLRDNKYPGIDEDSRFNCEVDNEIGSKYLVLDLKVFRPEVNEKKQIKNFCGQ